MPTTGGAAARRVHVAEQLFTRYRDQIYRFCYARLRSREEAEDATQNVFMRVHMALQRGVVPEYEAAWLYKIAHNVCISRGESVARRARLETPHAFGEDDDVQIPAREASRDELAGLSEALHAMPANMRTAIVLREWQGLSYAEIAEAMGLTVPAVETLLFRSRRHLAAALEQGTPTPKRKLGGLFTLPAFLRRLLAGAAPAKLSAGAAMVALTGGGIGLGVAVADRPVQLRSAPLPAPRHITFLAGTGGAPAGAARRRTVSVALPRHRPTAVEPAVVATPVAAVVPAVRPRPSAPAATGPEPAAPATTAAVAPTVSASTQAATTTVAVRVPAVTTPVTTVTTVTVPAAVVPAVTVTTPVLPVTVTVGGVTLP